MFPTGIKSYAWEAVHTSSELQFKSINIGYQSIKYFTLNWIIKVTEQQSTN